MAPYELSGHLEAMDITPFGVIQIVYTSLWFRLSRLNGYTEHMHWELWDIESANLVGTCATEDEGLDLVRELTGKGWPVRALSLMVEDESVPVDQLPPSVSGEELARRAGLSGPDQVRRTA